MNIRFENVARMPQEEKERFALLRSTVRDGQAIGKRANEVLDESSLAEYLRLREWALSNAAQVRNRATGKRFNPCNHWRFQEERRLTHVSSYLRLAITRIIFWRLSVQVSFIPRLRPAQTCAGFSAIMGAYIVYECGRAPSQGRVIVAEQRKPSAIQWKPVTPIFSYVQTDSAKRVIAQWKEEIKTHTNELARKLDESERKALCQMTNEFCRSSYKSLPQYHKHYRQTLVVINACRQSFPETRKRTRKIRVAVHRKTQLVTVRDNAGSIIFCQRYSIVRKRDANNNPIGEKFSSNKNLRNCAVRYGVKLTRHDVVPNGTYVGSEYNLTIS